MSASSSTPDRPFFVHDKAICDSHEIGEGTRIWGFSHVARGARIGRRCNIGEQVFIEGNVSIGNGCTIKNGVAIWERVSLGDDVFVGPYVVFTNDLRPRAFIKRRKDLWLPTDIRRGATLGANSTIVCGVTIGEFAMVGAGSVVTKDIPPHALVIGNPMKVIARVCFCGEPLKEDFCPVCEETLAKNSPENAARRSQRR